MSLWRSFKEWTGLSKPRPNQELSRSQYALVSTGELTADTLHLWLGLPEEVRFDPALEPFRKLYEKQHGSLVNGKKQENATKRLPFVKSAPILGDDIQKIEEDACNGGKSVTEDGERKEEELKKNGDVVLTKVLNGKEKRLATAKYYIKMTALLTCWAFFTAMFLLYNEKEVINMNTAVVKGKDINHTIHLTDTHHSIQVELSGPFISEQSETALGRKRKMEMEVFSVWVDNETPWTIYLQNQTNFNEGQKRTHKFNIQPSNHTVIHINTTSSDIVPFAFGYTMNPIDNSTGVVYAVILLFGLYVLIIFEIINRTMAAILISTSSLAILSICGQRPTLTELISWLDSETLLLLLSMMLLVALTQHTGIFDFMAVFTFEVTKGRLWPLIFLLCTITAVVSTFLDNVTTVLLMSPVTIRLCEVMDLDPVPILMFMAIYSNVGGTATPVGDPPCVIVASNAAVIDAGINFTKFTAHMSLGILLVFIQTTLQFRFMFRDSNKLRLNEPRNILDLRNQITIWRRAADSLPGLSTDVAVVRQRLERKITKLQDKLQVLIKESKDRACPRQQYSQTLEEMKKKYKIRDKALLVKAAVAITFVVVMFFMHSIPELNRVSLGWTALLGALLLLILADREDLEPILHQVEWSTLLFFAALFVLMEALSKLGLILYVGNLMEKVILQVDQSSRLAVAILLILWVSGLISAFVDNIPLTTMMVRVVVSIGTNPHLGLPMEPLIWALLFGACLGGNGTLIAASANVVCAGVAEQHGYKFTFARFFRTGFPVTIGHFLVASAYLLICHCVFQWH